MYILERTKIFVASMFCISTASFIFTVLAFMNGGYYGLMYGFTNDVPIIFMLVFAAIFILSLLMGIGFRAISKDIADELRYLDSKK